MPDWLDEIEARWSAAIPGPYRLEGAKWALGTDPDETISGALVAKVGWIGSVQGRCTRATALALAAAPEDVARLVTEVRRLRGDVAPPAPEPLQQRLFAAQGGPRG